MIPAMLILALSAGVFKGTTGGVGAMTMREFCAQAQDMSEASSQYTRYSEQDTKRP